MLVVNCNIHALICYLIGENNVSSRECKPVELKLKVSIPYPANVDKMASSYQC
jgi:hypothetical protein